MSYGLLFKKTSTCRLQGAWFSIEYLDETSKPVKEISKGVKNSVSYLSKEEDLGKVLAGGYLRDRILERGDVAPEKWDNERRKRKITQEMIKTFKPYRGATGHKLVFSISKNLENLAKKANYDVDQILNQCMKQAMQKFQQKFHKGDRLAYAWGLHHDTKHPHCHVYLSNRTESGKYVAMSNPLKGKVDWFRKTPRKDQIGFIKNFIKSYEERIEEKLNLIISESKEKEIKTSDFRQRHYSNERIIIKSMSQKFINEKTNSLLLLKDKHKRILLQKEEIKSRFKLKIDTVIDGYKSIKNINKIIDMNYKELSEARKKLYKDSYIKYYNMSPWDRHLKKLSLLKNQKNIDGYSDQISKLKDVKEEQIKQIDSIKKLTEERNYILSELKNQQDRLQKDFKERLSEYEFARNRDSVQNYLNNVASSFEQKQYLLVLASLKNAKKNNLDTTKELDYLKEIRVKSKEYFSPTAMPKVKDLFKNYEDIHSQQKSNESDDSFTNHTQSTYKQDINSSQEMGEGYGY